MNQIIHMEFKPVPIPLSKLVQGIVSGRTSRLLMVVACFLGIFSVLRTGQLWQAMPIFIILLLYVTARVAFSVIAMRRTWILDISDEFLKIKLHPCFGDVPPIKVESIDSFSVSGHDISLLSRDGFPISILSGCSSADLSKCAEFLSTVVRRDANMVDA